MEGRAAGLHGAQNAPLAARRRTGRAFLVVNPEGMLEIAERAVGLSVVAQRRAAGRERRVENLADRAREAPERSFRPAGGRDQPAAGGERRNPGAVQRLADIDIAEPGDHALIQQQGLDRRRPAAKGAGEKGGVERVAQRLDPEAVEQLVRVERRRRDEQHEAEAARVVVGDAGAVFHMEDDVIVDRAPVAGMMEAAGDLPLDAERAAHAEMHDERLVPVEIGQQIFGPPPQGENASACEPRGEVLREGEAQIRAPLLDAQESRALERGREAPPHSLDLGQFGHGKSLRAARAFAAAARCAITAQIADREWRMKLNEAAIVEALRARLPDAMAIYLFGSVASGDAGPESDVDLAVLNDGTLDPVALWEIAGALADLVGRDVDLVDLRTASTVLQHQIVTRGKRLYARDARADFYEAFILSEKDALDARNAGLMGDILREGRVYGR